MRCPDCSKFVSLETQEPQVDSIDCSFERDGKTEGHFDITASGTTTRNCADCGTELKAVSWDAEGTVEIDLLKGWDDMSEAQQVEFLDKIDNGDLLPEISEDSTESDESGGSRYKKNMITSRVYFTITIGDRAISDQCIETENAASEFEEQC